MALFSMMEILDLLIMTAALGYVFMSYIPQPRTQYMLTGKRLGFNWDDFKFAIYVTAPAVVLHELMHKFVALWLGVKSATFSAWYFGLFLGIFLKVIHSPFILFAPGYVSIASGTPPLVMSLTAFAGPATNLGLFVLAWFVVTRKKKMSKNEAMFWYLTKQINLFLFFFNMIPFPPLDGSKVFGGLWNAFF
jgi:Zn-dependent protease